MEKKVWESKVEKHEHTKGGAGHEAGRRFFAFYRESAGAADFAGRAISAAEKHNGNSSYYFYYFSWFFCLSLPRSNSTAMLAAPCDLYFRQQTRYLFCC